jgi:hypothetical protein
MSALAIILFVVVLCLRPGSYPGITGAILARSFDTCRELRKHLSASFPHNPASPGVLNALNPELGDNFNERSIEPSQPKE